MPNPIYLPQKTNQFTDQVYRSLLQYAVMKGAQDEKRKEREFVVEQRNQERRDAIDMMDKQRNWDLEKMRLQGDLEKVGSMPKSPDKAKSMLDSGDVAAMGGGNMYKPVKDTIDQETIANRNFIVTRRGNKIVGVKENEIRNSEEWEEIPPIKDENGNVILYRQKNKNGKISYHNAPIGSKKDPLEELGYHKIDNKVVRFGENDQVEILFNGDKEPEKWSDPIISQGSKGDPFPKGTVFMKKSGSNETKIISKPKEKDPFQAQAKLRGEFNRLSKDYISVRDAFGRIKASASDPSAAGDLAMIFNYMKVLDPGSTVREGEFATAQNSASIPARLRATYNKVLSGKRLAPSTRKDFVSRATKLYDRQLESHRVLEGQYRRLAKSYGFDPHQTIIDHVVDFSKPPPVTSTQDEMFKQYGIVLTDE